MTTVLCSRIFFRNHRCLLSRRLHSADPKDTISPPTKAWRYVVKKFIQFVEKYETKLEKKSPKAFNVYKTLKSVRYIAADTKDYVMVSKDIWAGRELHTFTRQELEVYQEFPKDMVKIVSLLLLASIPFIGNFLVIVGYMFPRTLFTHHLWNDQQKEEFGQYFHTKRLAHYHNLLEHIDKQASRHTTGETRQQFATILDKLAHSSHPSVQELLHVKSEFMSFPFSIDSLSTVYFRHLAKVCDISLRRRALEHDGLLWLHIDRAMVREGIENMTEKEICKACLKRGLNPYGLTQEERIRFLQKWTTLSSEIDETSVSLLLHCPVLLTYNSQSNILLMKGKRYRWRRKVVTMKEED